MAETTSTQGTAINEVVGKVFILYGKVKAIAPDGTVRILTVNSPVFAMDRIVTESDGSVAIMFDGPPQAQIEIGRMSDVLIDEDVYAGATPEQVAETTAEVEDIQAMLQGEGEIELEAPAAGGPADSGGGHPTVVFDLTANEVVPDSGAETTGPGDHGTVEPYDAEGEESAVPYIPYVANVTVTAVTAPGAEGFFEGGQITYVATVDNPPQGTPLVVSLDNGTTITIPVGEASGSVTVNAPSDDPYIDAGPVDAAIVDAQGGGYDEITIDTTPVEVQIADTIDPTTVSLTATPSVDEGGQVTYTATVTNPPQGDITVTLSNGETITIANGTTSGSVTVDAPTDDVYVDAGQVSATITGATTDNFEQLVIDETPAVTEIPDTIDTTTITLSASAETVLEGDPVTYTATVDHAPQGDLVITLDNGVEITIPDGQLSGSATAVQEAPDEGATLTVGISETSGGNYEDLDTSDTAVLSIGDYTPEGGETFAAVDDDGLAGGNTASTLGDLDANAGEPAPVTASEAIFSGTLAHTIGGDGYGSVTFADMDGLTGTVGTETVTYSWSGNTLTATGPRGELFNVAVDPGTGDYTVTLVDNVLHESLDGLAG